MEKTYENYTAELDEYIAKTKSRLSGILSALDWNEVDTLKESTCSGHSTSEEQKDDPLLPESFESMHSIVIDEEKLKEIVHSTTVVVPKKFSDIQVNFNTEQKLALYEHVVLNTGKISEPELKVSLSSDYQGGNEMTFAEIVAKAKKSDKQLKRKYRTSKPTHTEEVCNLVHLQMQALARYFNPTPTRGEEFDAAGCSGLSRARKRSRSRSGHRRRSKIDQSRSRDRRRSKNERDLSRSRSRDSRRSKHDRDLSRSRSRHRRRSKNVRDLPRCRSRDRRRSNKQRDLSRSRSRDRRTSKIDRDLSRSPSRDRRRSKNERDMCRSRSNGKRSSKNDRDLSRSRHRSHDEHTKDKKKADIDTEAPSQSKKHSKKNKKSKKHKSSKSKKRKHHRKSKENID